MIKIGTPTDAKNFVLVKDSKKVLLLHEMGFLPSYKDSKGVYFKATPELFRIIR